MRRAFMLAQLLALVVAGEVLAQGPGGAVPLNGGCAPGQACKAARYIATTTQGIGSSQCLVQGGIGSSGVCLGGFPASGWGSLYLGITPSTRSTGNYSLLGSGSTTVLNAPTTIQLAINGSAQWDLNTSRFGPSGDNAESLGAQSIAMANVYSWIYSSRLNAQFVAFASPTASATSTSAPAFLFRQTTNTLDADDLLLDVQDLNNVSRFKVDIEGDVTAAGVVRGQSASFTGSGGVSVAGNISVLGTNGVAAKNTAKAWFELDIACSTATCVLSDSYNVTSVTRLATGTYNVNFTNALPSSSYAILCNLSGLTGFINASSNSSTVAGVGTSDSSATQTDALFSCVVFDN